MFDIAAVARAKGVKYLAQPLSSIPDRVEMALGVATAYQSQLLRPVLSELNVKADFEELRETARDDTMEVLRMALSISSS